MKLLDCSYYQVQTIICSSILCMTVAKVGILNSIVVRLNNNYEINRCITQLLNDCHLGLSLSSQFHLWRCINVRGYTVSHMQWAYE